MVARPKMTASVHGRVSDTEKAHAELVKAVGRGTSALRDSQDNVLEMASGGSAPTLVSIDNDVAVQWSAQTLSVVDQTTAEDRDLTARGGSFSGAVASSGAVSSIGPTLATVGAAVPAIVDYGMDASLVFFNGNLYVADQVNGVARGIYGSFGQFTTVTGTTVNVSGGINCGANTQTSSFIRVAGGNITTDPNGSMNSLNYYGGTFHGVDDTSERRLKDEESIIRDGLDVVNRLVPARWRWKEPSRDTDAGEDHRIHAGIYVDELIEVAPEAVRRQMMPDEDRITPVPNGEITYEDRAIIAYLVSAVQTLSDRLDALHA